MIAKQDILDRAEEWQLRADIVEKDYVLGWFLAAIADHSEAGPRWVFKGGTCLKKCYFETYRFSEDLDFSLLPDAVYTREGLAQILGEVAERTTELSGIAFPVEVVAVRERVDRQGRVTFEGKVGYRGPLSVPTTPRLLLDITRHELLLDSATRCSIFHPYPDDLPDGAQVSAYSLAELFAEKTRALYERTRPRDLYDVVFLLANRAEAIDFDHTRELFRKKCRVKGFEPPSAATVVALARQSPELRAEWANMLAHQLPQLPPIESMLGRLDDLLGWIDAPVVLPITRLPAATGQPGEELVAPPGVTLWGAGVPLEIVRFAGANRLMIEFTYNGERRIAEPYSLRRARTGNLLLYAWERGSTHVKAFNVREMSSVRATNMPFTPRYRVEFTASTPLSAPPAATPPLRSSMAASSSRRTARRNGPTYVFQCPYCQKLFRHSTRDASLRKHKDAPGSLACPGRRGYLLRIE